MLNTDKTRRNEQLQNLLGRIDVDTKVCVEHLVTKSPAFDYLLEAVKLAADYAPETVRAQLLLTLDCLHDTVFDIRLPVAIAAWWQGIQDAEVIRDLLAGDLDGYDLNLIQSEGFPLLFTAYGMATVVVEATRANSLEDGPFPKDYAITEANKLKDAVTANPPRGPRPNADDTRKATDAIDAAASKEFCGK